MYRSIIFSFLLTSFILADSRMATVSGNAYLSDQTDDHSGIKVLFHAESASATSDSVYSSASGAYAVGLTDGIYTVHFSKTGYIPYTIPGTFTWGGGSYTLDDVTLQAGAIIEVSGRTNGIWYDDYQYRVVGDLEIDQGDTLIIEPGTTILFMGQYEMKVYGSLIAVGTEQDSIHISSGQAVKDVLDWNGIYFANSSDENRELVLQYCNIGYGGNGNYGRMLYFDNIFREESDKAIKILDCKIHHSSERTVFVNRSRILISGSEFVHWGQYDAIYGEVISARIEDNQIIWKEGDNYSTNAINIYFGWSEESEGRKITISNNIFSARNYMGSIYNTYSNSNDIVDSLFVLNNTFTGSYNHFYTGTYYGHYGLWEGNTFKRSESYFDGYAISFSNNDQTHFVNNSLIGFDFGARFNSNTATVFENNILDNRHAFYPESGSIPATTIAYNDILFQEELTYSSYMDRLPVGLGDILTVNANGDSADTYMNIFLDPLFVPDDSTIFYSWAYEDSLLYVTFNPPDHWGDTLSYGYVTMGIENEFINSCCWNYYLYPEFINVNGSRSAGAAIASPGVYRDANAEDNESGIDPGEPIHDIDNDINYRRKNGLDKIAAGADIKTYGIQEYLEITPERKASALSGGPAEQYSIRDLTTTDITISVTVDSWADEASWNIYDYQQLVYLYEDNQTFSDDYETQEVVLPLDIGSYSVDCWDTYGDGGIAGTVTDSDDNVLVSWGTNDYTDFGEFVFSFGDVAYGCTDPEAINYDPEATAYDGSCYYYGDSCSIALEAVLGLNEASGGFQWFEYTAVSNEQILISSDFQGQYEDTYLGVFTDCDSEEPIVEIDDNGQHYSYASVANFSCTAGQTYYIVWADVYSPGPFTWSLMEGHYSDSSYATYINIYDQYDNYGYVYDRMDIYGYNPFQGSYYMGWEYNLDFIGEPDNVTYASYGTDLSADSPCIDAGNPAVELYDPDGTIADIGPNYYHQGDTGEIPAPVAGFTVSSTSGAYPFFVEFTSTSTGAITGYSWNFGDGNSSSATRPVHLYNAEGVYSVSLTVTGPGGEDTAIETDLITVTSPSLPPIVSFVGEPTAGLVPLTVSFTSTILNSIDSVLWSFGDGGSSSDVDPTHTYETVGTYTVSLTGHNQYGTDIATLSSYISVLSPEAIMADFSAAPLLGVAPLTVSFTNGSIGTLDSVRWNFSDGGTSTQLSPFHTFEGPGVYDVTMMAHGPVNSDTSSQEDYIDVYDERPIITSIEDIPNDQGGQVLLRWDPSGWDGPVGTTVTQYALWEDYNGEWISVNTAMANQSESYAFLASTFGDSTSDGVHWSRFKVIAHTADPGVFYESPVDSGYSVDNVPPQTPGTVLANLGETGVELEWGEVDENNFMYYNLYRNGEIIAQLVDYVYTDLYTEGQVPHYYRVTAVDDVGNESDPTPETMVNTTNLSWFINIRGIMMGGENDLFNFIGAADEATAGFDESFDIFEPPASPGSFLSVYFPHPDWELELGDLFAQDIRQNIDLSDTMHVWDVDLTANVSDSAVFLFDLVDVPNVPIMIEHLQSGERAYISDSTWFGFNMMQDSVYSFRISIGDTTSPTLALDDNTNGPQILLSDSTHIFSWVLDDGNGLDSVYTYFSRDSGETFEMISGWDGHVDTLAWVVPDTTVSYGYVFYVEARDYAGNWVYDMSDHVFAVAGDSLSSFVGSGWNLWGTPMVPYNGQMNENVGDDIDGYWYTYGFTDNGYTFDSTLALGHGYWLGIMEDADVDVLGTPLDHPHTAPLTLGWNMVSNPLVLDIVVDSLVYTKDSESKVYADAVTDGWVNTIYGHDSLGYSMSDVLKPWEGYWMSVLDTGITVTYPIHQSVSDGEDRQSRDESSWMISFEATIEGAVDRTAIIGVAADATDGFDAMYDIAKAPNPPGGDFVAMATHHPDWESVLGDRFAKDVRAPVESGAWTEWIFFIESSHEEVDLTWSMDGMPDEYDIGYNFGDEVFFTDLGTAEELTLDGNSELIIRVGTDVLGNDDGKLLPDVFALHQNYPNPFNPVTSIRYDLPNSEKVQISIYDLMGREIRMLVNEHQEAGFRMVQWNAANDHGQQVSAGMYIYDKGRRFQADKEDGSPEIGSNNMKPRLSAGLHLYSITIY